VVLEIDTSLLNRWSVTAAAAQAELRKSADLLEEATGLIAKLGLPINYDYEPEYFQTYSDARCQVAEAIDRLPDSISAVEKDLTLSPCCNDNFLGPKPDPIATAVTIRIVKGVRETAGRMTGARGSDSDLAWPFQIDRSGKSEVSGASFLNVKGLYQLIEILAPVLAQVKDGLLDKPGMKAALETDVWGPIDQLCKDKYIREAEEQRRNCKTRLDQILVDLPPHLTTSLPLVGNLASETVVASINGNPAKSELVKAAAGLMKIVSQMVFMDAADPKLGALEVGFSEAVLNLISGVGPILDQSSGEPNFVYMLALQRLFEIDNRIAEGAASEDDLRQRELMRRIIVPKMNVRREVQEALEADVDRDPAAKVSSVAGGGSGGGDELNVIAAGTQARAKFRRGSAFGVGFNLGPGVKPRNPELRRGDFIPRLG